MTSIIGALNDYAGGRRNSVRLFLRLLVIVQIIKVQKNVQIGLASQVVIIDIQPNEPLNMTVGLSIHMDHVSST